MKIYKNYKLVRFPVVKIFLTAFVFFFIGIFSSTFAIMFITPQKKQVRVPNLVGQEYEKALEVLKKYKLKPKVNFKYSHIPQNHIISQLPTSGKQVKIGRGIEINVSKGPIFVEVPDITKLTLLKAKDILRPVGNNKNGNIGGLKIGEVTYVHSPEVEKDCIIAQNPCHRKKVPKDSSINVLVSLGEKKLTLLMPDLTNLKSSEALTTLNQLGLTLKSIEHKVDKNAEEDIVLNQNPEVDTEVTKDDLVTLVVSAKKIKETEQARNIFITYKTPDGFYHFQVRILVKDFQGEREVYNQKTPPGSKVELGVEVSGKAKAIIYLNEVLKEEREL
ncbi:PASTA domain-containing protein [bacterium]|nr:PASTA domain-containing protein [bacterium]MBU1153438.1 PASTA domain-containing protein [bacterium]MBU2600037.1 PASTA domain-containing protein [bacterium]